MTRDNAPKIWAVMSTQNASTNDKDLVSNDKN